MALNSILSKETIEKYNKDGIIKISLPSEISKLQNEFLLDCCHFLKKWTSFETTPEKLPFDLVALSKINRNIVGKLYKVSKRFRSSRALSCHPYFTSMAKELMNTELISCYHLTIVRIDLPNEEKFLMPLVSPGGVVLLDEYGMADFQGESLAFDEYFGENKPTITKFPFTPTPGGFFIKK